ncbi:MAG: AMP-binding protein [bacterium]|nr:AMP-binding protein [bacterium]
MDINIAVESIRILSEEERKEILYGLNDTNVAFPKDRTIYALFEEQAACLPGETALVFEDERMTYGQLNETANKVARILREKGVEKDSIVGIMVYDPFIFH